MAKIETVEEYISSKPNRTNELKLLREILLTTELEEGIKWGAPAYMINGKNVMGLAAFKSYVGIWFHNGVFLTDKQNKLFNAQENKTKAMRQWRFYSLKEIEENKQLIRNYALEAIENQKQGKELKPAKSKPVVNIPTLMKQAFKQDKQLAASFDQLTPGKQKEYANYIAEAKRESTKESRWQKIIPLIKQGKGLYDKYKNC